jgi:hypothetical protein
MLKLRGLKKVLRAVPTPNFLISYFFNELRPRQSGFELVRVGPKSDGGYLVPDIDLSSITYVISPGVADNWGFENDMQIRFGVPSIMVDGGIETPDNLPAGALFKRLWLGSRSKKDTITLGEIVTRFAGSSDNNLLLQMDIEGAEYRTIPLAKRIVLTQFRIIVVELHHLHQTQFLFEFLWKFLPTLLKLKKTHEVVHVHANNCMGVADVGRRRTPHVVELTLLRRDLMIPESAYAEVPHSLDKDCVPALPPVSADVMWSIQERSAR